VPVQSRKALVERESDIPREIIAEAVLEHLAGAPLPSDEAVLRIFEETILMIDCAIRAFIGEDAGLG
jgi:transcriptional regulator of met regulon